jgi:hypothetical protein
MAKSGNADLAKQKFNDLRREWRDSGQDTAIFNQAFTDTISALKEADGAATSGSGSFATLDEALAGSEEAARATEEAINGLKDAILNLNETGINAEEAELAFKAGLDELAQGAADAAVGLDGTTQGSRDYIQSMLDMEEAARNSAVAVIDNGGSVEEAMGKYYAARDAIIAARVAKGEDAATAEAWADRVLGSAAEAEQSIRQYSDEVNRVPEAKTTRIYADTAGAYRDVNSLIDYINNRTATFTVTQRIVYESSVLSGGRGHLVPGAATGGQIVGPGTGTSDSILTRLSNGEYVVKAAAVNYYGPELMSAINNMRVPKFASGGQVGSSSGGSSVGMLGGVVELGPQTMAQMSRDVTNNILLDDVALSRSVQRGNEKRRSTGDTR